MFHVRLSTFFYWRLQSPISLFINVHAYPLHVLAFHLLYACLSGVLGGGGGGGVITSWKLQTFLCRCSVNVSCNVITFLLLTLAISHFTVSQCSCLPIACACVSSSIWLLVWGFGWGGGGCNNVLETSNLLATLSTRSSHSLEFLVATLSTLWCNILNFLMTS